MTILAIFWRATGNSAIPWRWVNDTCGIKISHVELRENKKCVWPKQESPPKQKERKETRASRLVSLQTQGAKGTLDSGYDMASSYANKQVKS